MKWLSIFCAAVVSVYPLYQSVSAANTSSPVRISHQWVVEKTPSPIATIQPNGRIQVRTTFVNPSPSAQMVQVPSNFSIHWYLVDNDHTLAWGTSALAAEGASREFQIPANGFKEIVWTAKVPANLGGNVLARLGPQEMGTDSMFLRVDSTWAEQPKTTVAQTENGKPAKNPTAAAADYPNTYPELGEKNMHQRLTQAGFFSGISANEPVYFIAGGADDVSARFQLSFKYRLFEPEFSASDSFWDRLYFGYSQVSIWDLSEESKPFRDTSYRPSFFWRDERLWRSEDNRWFIGADSGYEHESNGKAGKDSRSLDMLYVRPRIHYRMDNSTLSFLPRVKWNMEESENPDITGYRGYVDWQLRWAHDAGLTTSVWLRQGYKHGSQQIDVAYPMAKVLNTPQLNGFFYVQYFQGYGLTLLEYNEKAKSQVRFGLAIVP